MGIFPEYSTTRRLIGKRDRVRVVRRFYDQSERICGVAIRIGAEFDITVITMDWEYDGLTRMTLADTLSNAVLLQEIEACFGRTKEGVDHFVREECRNTPWFLVCGPWAWPEHRYPGGDVDWSLEHDLCDEEADELFTRKWRAHLARRATP